MTDIIFWVGLGAIICITLFFIILIQITYHLSAIHFTADRIHDDLKQLDSIRSELYKVVSNTDDLSLIKFYAENILDKVRDLTLLNEIRAIKSNQDEIIKEANNMSSLINIQTKEMDRLIGDLDISLTDIHITLKQMK